MDSPYKKTGLSNQKEAYIKQSLKSAINDLPHVSNNPFVKLGYSTGLTGNIEPHERLEQFTRCSCKSDEEHKAKWENYKKSQPLKPLDFDTIKNIIGWDGNERLFIDILNQILNKNISKKQKGRRQKFITQKYQITQEDLQDLEKKATVAICEYLRITEKDFIKIVEKNKDSIFMDLAFSSFRLPLPRS